MRNHVNAARVVDKARRAAREARDLAAEELSEANSFIHRKPLLSAAIGVGLGFLLASLFRSRD